MTTLTSARELPDHGCFVLSNDRYLSYSAYAPYKINTVILWCETYDEAKIVARQAAKRSDQKYIRSYFWRKPRLNFQTHLYNYHTKEDYDAWYDPTHEW